MIIKKFYETREDGVNLYLTYSDNNLCIQKVGTEEIYSEAVDVESAPYEYVETDIPIDGPTGDEISDSEALAIILGEVPNETV